SIFQEGVTAQGKGDFATAPAKSQEVERQVPTFAPAVFNLGLVLDDQTNFTEALVAFERVLRIAPQYSNVRLCIGIEQAQLNDPLPAIESLTLAVKENPRDKQGWFWIARARLLLHQDDEALIAAKNAEEIVPGDASVEFLIANVYIEQQEWERSETILK